MPNGYVVWPATTVFLSLPDYCMPTLCNAPRHNYDVFHPVAVMYEQEYRNNIMLVCLMYVAMWTSPFIHMHVRCHGHT